MGRNRKTVTLYYKKALKKANIWLWEKKKPEGSNEVPPSG